MLKEKDKLNYQLMSLKSINALTFDEENIDHIVYLTESKELIQHIDITNRLNEIGSLIIKIENYSIFKWFIDKFINEDNILMKNDNKVFMIDHWFKLSITCYNNGINHIETMKKNPNVFNPYSVSGIEKIVYLFLLEEKFENIINISENIEPLMQIGKKNLSILDFLLKTYGETIFNNRMNFFATCLFERKARVIEFILDSNSIDKNFIHKDNDIIIRLACFHNRLDVVKYLLTSHTLKEHANIYANDNSAIKLLIENLSELMLYTNKLKDTKDILIYLLLDYKIILNKEIEEIMSSNEEMKELVQKRKFNDRLQLKLSTKLTSREKNNIKI